MRTDLDVFKGAHQEQPFSHRRDHCIASQSRDTGTLQRLVDTLQVPLALYPRDACVNDAGELEISWPTSALDPAGHTSTFPPQFLLENRYWVAAGEDDVGDRAEPIDDPATTSKHRVVWSRGTFLDDSNDLDVELFPSASYKEVMQSDAGLDKWVRNIRDWGFGVVVGVPVSMEATEQLAKRIGPLQRTIYGCDMWKTEVRMDR